MVNCDGPTEQNCCLKCAYVSSAESYLALTICMLSHQRSAAVSRAAQPRTSASRHHRGKIQSARFGVFLHSQHICFNLTLSILEMRCNPVKPLFWICSAAASLPFMGPANTPVEGSQGPKSTQKTWTDKLSVLQKVSFLITQSRSKSLWFYFIKHTLATIFL